MSEHEPHVREDGLVEDDATTAQPISRRGRRVSTAPVDAEWQEPELERRQSDDNDERLRGDRPPHWG